MPSERIADYAIAPSSIRSLFCDNHGPVRRRFFLNPSSAIRVAPDGEGEMATLLMIPT
jgi:hypothetical protein